MNERLTRVGPGTSMGKLLRWYWWPVAASAELLANPVKQVHILGETLTLFRDRKGRLGLIAERCAHRKMNLMFGIPEEDGLRCPTMGGSTTPGGSASSSPRSLPTAPSKTGCG